VKLKQKSRHVQHFLKNFKRQNKYEKKLKMLQYNLNQAMAFLEADKEIVKKIRQIINASMCREQEVEIAKLAPEFSARSSDQSELSIG